MHTVSVSFIKSPQQTASQKCIATESAPRRMARHEHMSSLFSKKTKKWVLRVPKTFCQRYSVSLFLMRTMVVSSLVEVNNVSALAHTRDLDRRVVIKEHEVNYSAGEFWSLIVLWSHMRDHHIILNGQE